MENYRLRPLEAPRLRLETNWGGSGSEPEIRSTARLTLLALPAELRLKVFDLALPPQMILQKTNIDGKELGDAT